MNHNKGHRGRVGYKVQLRTGAGGTKETLQETNCNPLFVYIVNNSAKGGSTTSRSTAKEKEKILKRTCKW